MFWGQNWRAAQLKEYLLRYCNHKVITKYHQQKATVRVLPSPLPGLYCRVHRPFLFLSGLGRDLTGVQNAVESRLVRCSFTHEDGLEKKYSKALFT